MSSSVARISVRWTTACWVIGALACGGGAASGEPPDIEVCEKMSAAVVQPYLDPIADGRTLEPVVPGLQSCSYRILSVGQLRQVRGFIDYTWHDTAEKAQASIQVLHDDAVVRGYSHVEWVPGLGDKAFISQEGESVGIKLARGRMAMQVNVANELAASFDTLAGVVKGLCTKALDVMPTVR